MYKLSVQAERDIAGLYRYTISQFGTLQANSYLNGLNDVLKLLAEFPTMGIAVDQIRAGLRRHIYESHTIYYRIKPKNIFITRVIHNQMDHRRYM